MFTVLGTKQNPFQYHGTESNTHLLYLLMWPVSHLGWDQTAFWTPWCQVFMFLTGGKRCSPTICSPSLLGVWWECLRSVAPLKWWFWDASSLGPTVVRWSSVSIFPFFVFIHANSILKNRSSSPACAGLICRSFMKCQPSAFLFISSSLRRTCIWFDAHVCGGDSSHQSPRCTRHVAPAGHSHWDSYSSGVTACYWPPGKRCE